MTQSTYPAFCRGKQRFKFYGYAEQWAQRWATRKGQAPLKPWLCSACGTWHIGERPAESFLERNSHASSQS